ncbi:hypothetical protein XENOCAPTIV_020461 [Xenoophorus captivus]|uniref:Smad anchor for receptor activation-like C-terminal domain-containing protein n=1 Tax=Xenoophorus captivus TaxID=1517983 RepID=A0ABV0RIG2_9TELE
MECQKLHSLCFCISNSHPIKILFFPREVGFVAGSNGQPLPAQYLNALDSVLIPVIHSRGHKRGEKPLVMELIFYILEDIT